MRGVVMGRPGEPPRSWAPSARPVVDELRERWRTRSMEVGWSLPGDWWCPAVEAVVTAVGTRQGLAVACARLGQARGRAGVGIGETLDDVGALFAALGRPDPPLSLVRCVAEGWADCGMMPSSAVACQDPLTGLMTVSYLRGRLTELYRSAAGLGAAPNTSASETHCLVIVDLPGPAEPWRRLARAVVLAHDLRTVFRGGETLTLVGTTRAAALVPFSERLDAQLGELRRLFTRTLKPSVRASPGADGGKTVSPPVWVERLPGCLAEALELLEVLSR